MSISRVADEGTAARDAAYNMAAAIPLKPIQPIEHDTLSTAETQAIHSTTPPKSYIARFTDWLKDLFGYNSSKTTAVEDNEGPPLDLGREPVLTKPLVDMYTRVDQSRTDAAELERQTREAYIQQRKIYDSNTHFSVQTIEKQRKELARLQEERFDFTKVSEGWQSALNKMKYGSAIAKTSALALAAVSYATGGIPLLLQLGLPISSLIRTMATFMQKWLQYKQQVQQGEIGFSMYKEGELSSKINEKVKGIGSSNEKTIDLAKSLRQIMTNMQKTVTGIFRH